MQRAQPYALIIEASSMPLHIPLSTTILHVSNGTMAIGMRMLALRTSVSGL